MRKLKSGLVGVDDVPKFAGVLQKIDPFYSLSSSIKFGLSVPTILEHPAQLN